MNVNNAQSGQILSNPTKMIENNELRDIVGPIPLPDAPSLLFVGAGVIALLLAAAIVVYLKRKGRRRHQERAIPPWERALAELDSARQLLDTAQHLAYLERISEILRQYIEQCFGLASTRQTTVEFFAGLTSTESRILHDAEPSLRRCLEVCDLAKYARAEPQEIILAKVEEEVRAFIRKTIPAPEERA